MPTTIQTQPQPRTVSKTFAYIICAGILAGLAAIMLAVYHPHQEPPPPGLRVSNNDDSWIDRPTPAPVLTPRPLPTVAPFHPPVAAQSPAFHLPLTPNAAPTMSEEEREHQRRYLAALNSDIGIKVNRQTLETPRMLASNSSASSSDGVHVTLNPPPPHTVAAFTWIDGTLETALDSDHAGDVLGRVSADVKDSATQTEVLIPAGSILHGWHGGREALDPNDDSLLVVWRDLEFPNGARIHLPDLPGSNTAGQPGFSEFVDHHYAKTWGPAVLISGIIAGVALASHPTYGSINGVDANQQAFGIGAEALGAHAIGQLGAGLNALKPTIRVESGYQFRVLCTKDLVFSGPYGE